MATSRTTLEGFKVTEAKPHETKSGERYYQITVVSERKKAKLSIHCFCDTLAFLGIESTCKGAIPKDSKIYFAKGLTYDLECDLTLENSTENGVFALKVKWAKLVSYQRVDEEPNREKLVEKKEIKPITAISGFGKEGFA